MPRATVIMPDEFLKKLSRLEEKTDEVAEKVLDAGAEVVLAKAKSNLASVIGRGVKHPSKSTGELASSFGISPAKVDKSGNHNVKVGFAEPRRSGGVNAKIANIIEYGKHGQPAKPFLKPAKTQARKAMKEAMERKLEEEVRKL
jgi:HK97 gp10 family phage protein